MKAACYQGGEARWRLKKTGHEVLEKPSREERTAYGEK